MQSDLPPGPTTASTTLSADDLLGSATPRVDNLAHANAPDAQAHRPVLVGASALGGCVVFASDGESVGVVTEVIVDVAGRLGQIAYVLVAPTHPAVGQSELRALPWSALSFDPARHCLMLEVSSAVVRNAPEAISKGWPIMPDDRWKTDVHRYYHPIEADTPSATMSGVYGHVADPIEPPVSGLAHELVTVSIEPSLDLDADADPKAVEHDFLPELGLKSPFRRRGPGSN